MSLFTRNEEHTTDREDKKKLRKEHLSGWLSLTQHDAIPILVGALLALPPNREFNKTELAEHAGVTRQTVGNYTDSMQEVELIKEVPNTSLSLSVLGCRQRCRPRTVRVE